MNDVKRDFLLIGQNLNVACGCVDENHDVLLLSSVLQSTSTKFMHTCW